MWDSPCCSSKIPDNGARKELDCYWWRVGWCRKRRRGCSKQRFIELVGPWNQQQSECWRSLALNLQQTWTCTHSTKILCPQRRKGCQSFWSRRKQSGQLYRKIDDGMAMDPSSKLGLLTNHPGGRHGDEVPFGINLWWQNWWECSSPSTTPTGTLDTLKGR